MSQRGKGRRGRAHADSEEEEEYDTEPTQRATSSQKRKSNTHDDDEYETQPSSTKKKKSASGASQVAEVPLSDEQKEKLVSDCVRYVLSLDHHKIPIKRDDIVKNVMGEYRGKGLVAWVLERVKKLFSDIFGFDFIEVPKKASSKTGTEKTSGIYILRNNTSEEIREALNEIRGNDEKESAEKGFLLAILAMIFLNKVVDEDLLFDQLRRLGFYEDEPHEILGDWKKLIENKFTKELYLDRSKTDRRSARTQKTVYEYRIGPRSAMEIHKRKILEFIAVIYGEEIDPVQAKELESDGENEEIEESDDNNNNNNNNNNSNNNNNNNTPKNKSSGSGSRRNPEIIVLANSSQSESQPVRTTRSKR